MKQPTLSQFKAALKELTEDIPAGKLKEIIYAVSDETRAENRLDFLKMVEQVVSGKPETPEEKSMPALSPEALFERIEDYIRRMESGEFYDEERDYEEYHRDEYAHYGNDYYDYAGDSGISTDEYVPEMKELLEAALSFYNCGDMKTALKAYGLIFGIIDDDIYRDEEYFFYGFSFRESLGDSFFNGHKLRYLRSFYLCNTESGQKAVFDLFSSQHSILLSDIADAENMKLPGWDRFTDSYIGHLSEHPEKANHLVDALFVKGGIDELRRFAYEKGNKIPAVFLAFFNEQQERDAGTGELMKIALDGIRLIPEKYASRSILSTYLGSVARNKDDRELLLTAYSSAFYSNPTPANLDAYLGYITQYSIREELDRFELFLADRKSVMKDKEPYTSFIPVDAFSLNRVNISRISYIVSHYIFYGIGGLLGYIDGSILGFSGEKQHIPAILSLLFISVSPSGKAVIIDILMNKYCFENDYKSSNNLKQLIYRKAGQDESSNVNIKEELRNAENIALRRVRHILTNKLRGGYEPSCLLLVACAEAKETLDQSGNRLINEVNTEFKRFSAFRRELKKLTQASKLLITLK